MFNFGRWLDLYLRLYSLTFNVGGVYKRKLAPVRVSYWDDFLISYRVFMMLGYFIYLGYLKAHFILIKYTCDSKSQTLRMRYPFQSTYFTPKRVVVSGLHDTFAKFLTWVKFSLRYNNRGELTLGWLVPAWHFVVASCKQIWSHEREPEWTCACAKVAPV